MTFGYSYRTSDGERREDACEAPSRDAAFAALRERGIRPIRVWRVRRWYDVSKRSVALSAVSCALLALCAYVLIRRDTPQPTVRDDLHVRLAAQSPRKQIDGIDGDLSRLFSYRSEGLLARFACPARPVPDVSEAELVAASDDLADAIADPLTLSELDTKAEADLKRIVTGMKEEARLILASGRSSAETMRYFYDRQRMEEEHRKRIVRQVRDGELSAESANATFRTMGFAEVE